MDAVFPVAGRLERRPPVPLAVYGLATIAATVVSATIATFGQTSHPWPVAPARALIVAAPLAVGLYAIRSRPGERFGMLMIVTGVACFVTTLAESGNDWLYTVGRAAGWLVEVLLVYLILAFPTGRLPGRIDRLLVAAMAGAVLTMYLPRLVLAAGFEVPSPYTSCVRGCPANAFFLLGREPAFVVSVMRPVGVLLVFMVTTAVVVRTCGRVRAATPLTRRMLVAVLTIGVARAGALGIALVARQVAPGARAVEVAAWLLALAVPAFALAFLVGLFRWRLFAGAALQRLAERLRALPNAATLRRAFVEAFDDPTIEIVFPASSSDTGWMDSRGLPVQLPGPGSGRSVSEVRDRESVIAAIVHDEGLLARPELVQSGVALAAVVLDNQRLAAEAESSARELRRSRARIAAFVALERRRIERDLHDGAQQRLVALRIELELAEEVVQRDAGLGVSRLRELEDELDAALEELRSLAHGIYPPLLADRGLAEALRSAAVRSPLRVEIQAHAVARYGTEIESAVYFCVLEALQNVTKHARDAHLVIVSFEGCTEAELRFSVRDDGPGTAAIRPGAGITNMRERVAAIGGELQVTSKLGVGTTVRGRAPTASNPVV